MNKKDSLNGMYVKSSNDLGKEEDLFLPKDNEEREVIKQEFIRG